MLILFVACRYPWVKHNRLHTVAMQRDLPIVRGIADGVESGPPRAETLVAICVGGDRWVATRDG